VIAYVEQKSKGYDGDDNPERDALYYFLRERCGYEVLLYDYDWYFREDLPRLKKYSQASQIILVMVCQQEYSNEHERVISQVRKELSAEMPIVVFPGGFGEQFKERSDDKVYTFYHTDAELIEFIKLLALKWKPPTTILGVGTEEERNLLLSQLENAYTKHYLQEDDERMFGTPDFNHSIVAEALRIGLLPTIFLKEEFDDTLEEDERVFIPSKPSVYRQELRRIQKMTPEERKCFADTILRAWGREPAEGGGVYVTRVNCGSKVNGYAIDPITLETLINHRFGLHHMTGEMLARRILNIEALRTRKYRWDLSEDEERDCKWRLITGLIFNEIPGFETPILQLRTHESNNDHIRKIARLLKNQQVFIPVDFYGAILGG